MPFINIYGDDLLFAIHYSALQIQVTFLRIETTRSLILSFL